MLDDEHILYMRIKPFQELTRRVKDLKVLRGNKNAALHILD
jgi:hypothetical protein